MQQTFQRAVQFHQSGRLVEAEDLYRQLLVQQPDNPQLLHLLGLTAYQRGDAQAAVEAISRAVATSPGNADYLCNLGLALRAAGRPLDAVENFRRALQLTPQDAVLHNNLGSALQALDQPVEAEAAYCRALGLDAANAGAWFNLGNLCAEQARAEEAVDAYVRALQLAPDDADIHNNLANVLRESGRQAEAIDHYRAALQLQPTYPAAARHLGWLLQEAGQPAAAIACYRDAVIHDPADHAAWFNLGNALRDTGLYAEAVTCFREAIRYKPDDAETHNNLGNALRELGQLQQAIDCYREALRLDPALHHARVHLLHQCQHACDWRELESLSGEIRQLVREQPAAQVSPFAFMAIAGTTAEEQRRCAEQWVATQYARYDTLRQRLGLTHAKQAKQKLRVGYLSADFHEHATAYLMAEVFELHDRRQFEIVAYSYGPDDGSPMRHRLRKAFDRFEDLRALDDEQAARKIHADGVDILVDLKGYTAHNRTQILALRPAPIQINYLGYPGTLGAGFVDAIIGDPVVTPPEHAAFFSEKILVLPDCYQSNDRHRPLPVATDRAVCGLPAHGFVFCGFNQTFKIQPAMFDIWMRLLHAVPGSVLWLLASNNLAEGNLKREAESRGIAAGRLVFAPRLPLQQHLARQQLADLMLDTLPYNAHTTASDALWMGVPLVTCLGETFVGRVAASLLRAVGLPELVTTRLTDYEAMALRLARSPETLHALKQRLMAARTSSPLFDTERFTRNLESGYQTLWKQWLLT